MANRADRPHGQGVGGQVVHSSVCRLERPDDAGDEEVERAEVVRGFRVVRVFDVSQTDGEPLPSLSAPLLEGDAPAALWDGLAAQVVAAGFSLERGDCGGANGRTDFGARLVRVRSDYGGAQASKTLCHELGQVLLHDGTEYGTGCRGRAEVEAESVAYPLIWTGPPPTAAPVVGLPRSRRRDASRETARRGHRGALGSPCRRCRGASRGVLDHLRYRNCSPNTVAAYAYDLAHFWRFLAERSVDWRSFRPRDSLELLGYLREVPARGAAQRLGLALVAGTQGRPARRLAPTSVNRALSAVSSLFDFTIAAGEFEGPNPMQKRVDPAYQRVAERHRPFMGSASRQRPLRRAMQVKTVLRLPRPLSERQVDSLLAALTLERDRAMVLLMLHGGLRPGEVLGLHLDDVAYGRRRVTVRHRDDHPRGVRSKSRVERVVDIHEPTALASLSAYVMKERPCDAPTPLVFLVGGGGHRRLEPLGYPALARLFARAAERAGSREPWVTPHALRHTHATRMWEGGMRELTLQKRLGHASTESTRLYTRVSDAAVVSEYRRALGEDR